MGGGGVPSGGVYVTYGRSLKVQGKPNSRVDRYENGKKVQSRWYDNKGNAMRNRDYEHQNAHNNHEFPHDHEWEFKNGSMVRIPNNLMPDYKNFN